MSALYAVAGLLTLAKGIKDWREAKRNRAPKEKQPMNKKIYIGIGLLVGGFCSTIILFNILPLLMAIGHVMVVVGFVFLGRTIGIRTVWCSGVFSLTISIGCWKVCPCLLLFCGLWGQ